MKLFRFTVFMAALCVVGSLHAAGKKGGGGQATPVVTAQVISREAAPTTALLGEVIAKTEAELASRVAGLVKTLHVEEGDRVTAGAPLVSLDAAEARHILASRQAEWASAKAKLRKAEADLKRDRKLKGSKTISASRLLDREIEVDVQKAEVAKARVEVAIMRDRLNWHEIRAPMSGVVTARTAAEGQWIKIGDPVVGLVDPDRLEVKVMVPDYLAYLLTPGESLPIALSGRQPPLTVDAVLRAVIPRTDSASRNRPTYWTLPEGSGAVAGEEVRIRVPLEKPKMALLVHKDAIVRTNGATSVHVVTGADYQKKKVTLGRAFEGWFQVLNGLQEGDLVVVRGNERLRPGQKVKATPLKVAP